MSRDFCPHCGRVNDHVCLPVRDPHNPGRTGIYGPYGYGDESIWNHYRGNRCVGAVTILIPSSENGTWCDWGGLCPEDFSRGISINSSEDADPRSPAGLTLEETVQRAVDRLADAGVPTLLHHSRHPFFLRRDDLPRALAGLRLAMHEGRERSIAFWMEEKHRITHRKLAG